MSGRIDMFAVVDGNRTAPDIRRWVVGRRRQMHETERIPSYGPVSRDALDTLAWRLQEVEGADSRDGAARFISRMMEEPASVDAMYAQLTSGHGTVPHAKDGPVAGVTEAAHALILDALVWENRLIGDVYAPGGLYDWARVQLLRLYEANGLGDFEGPDAKPLPVQKGMIPDDPHGGSAMQYLTGWVRSLPCEREMLMNGGASPQEDHMMTQFLAEPGIKERLCADMEAHGLDLWSPGMFIDYTVFAMLELYTERFTDPASYDTRFAPVMAQPLDVPAGVV